MAATVEQARGLLHEVDALNHAIARAAPHEVTTFDLMDKRDLLLDELSGRLGVRAIGHEDGSVRIHLDGKELVGKVAVPELAFDSSNHSVLHPSGFELAVGGEALGFQSFLRNEMAVITVAFDTVVSDFVTALNAAHEGGWVSPTGMGGVLITHDPAVAGNAFGLAITDPAMLAAAATSGPPFPAFDGSNADALSKLGSALVAGGGTQTIEAAYRSILTEVDRAATRASARARAAASSLASSDRARVNTHGVCLEEERLSLREHKRMYERAATVMGAIDQALDVVTDATSALGR